MATLYQHAFDTKRKEEGRTHTHTRTQRTHTHTHTYTPAVEAGLCCARRGGGWSVKFSSTEKGEFACSEVAGLARSRQ